MKHSDLIFVKKIIGKGRGVFASKPIRKGAIIEKVPKMLFPVEFVVNGFDDPKPEFVFFEHEDDTKNLALCLGYGSLYNHSYEPNANYEDGPDQTMIFRAIRAIRAGEEICINYNGDPSDKSDVGFKVKGKKEIASKKTL